MMRWLCRYGWLVAVAAMVAAVSVLSVTIVFLDEPPIGIAMPEGRAEVVRNLGLVVGGVVALGIAVWRSKAAQDQVKVSNRDVLDRRFHNAVSLLSHQEVVSRLTGIQMLGHLAETDPQAFRTAVVDVLCAFARNPTAVEEAGERPLIPLPSFLDKDTQQAAKGVKRLKEIKAAVKIVVACNSSAKSERASGQMEIDLTGLALAEADFEGCDLSNANLEQAQLPRARLKGANLSNANLSFVDLRGADLSSTNLTKAQMTFANLRQADLAYANLAGAQMENAQMSDAFIYFTNCSGTSFSPAQDDESLSDPLTSLIEETAASGLTQRMVNKMWAEEGNPPKLRGIRDAETNEALGWSGKSYPTSRWDRWPYD